MTKIKVRIKQDGNKFYLQQKRFIFWGYYYDDFGKTLIFNSSKQAFDFIEHKFESWINDRIYEISKQKYEKQQLKKIRTFEVKQRENGVGNVSLLKE